MRFASRSLLAALSVAFLASCTDSFQGTVPGTRTSLAIVPRFSANASLMSATLTQAGIGFDHVRIVIVRPASDTLKDTTLVFTPTSAALTLELSIAAVPPEPLVAAVQFTQSGTLIFSGSANVKAVAATQAATATPVEVLVNYAGPGAAATKVTIAPGAGVYSATATTQFTAKAFDAGSIELLNTPLFWSVSNETLATISATGALTPKGSRGTVRVRAISANGVGDSVTVQLAPAAVGLRVVQGAAQKGSPGSILPLPVIIEAVGADGLAAPGAGLTATFTASGGAQISPVTVTFDATGRAQATMKLGTSAGVTYIYSATAGAFSVSWGESAAVGPPTHFVASGSTTLVLNAGLIPNPIPTLRLADALENSVPGLFVKVTIQSVSGGVAPFQVPTDSIGVLEVYKVAPTRAGNYTILVEADPIYSVPSITYTVTINPGPAAKLAFTGQPVDVAVNQPVTPAVTVAVQDQFGNTVTSAGGQNIAIAVDTATTKGVSQVGTGSATIISGVATFSNLRFNAVKTGARIQAIGFSLPGVLSALFNIIP